MSDSLFGIDAAYPDGRAGTPEPLTLKRIEDLALEMARRDAEEAMRPDPPLLVGPKTFAEWVRLGIIDEEGRWLR